VNTSLKNSDVGSQDYAVVPCVVRAGGIKIDLALANRGARAVVRGLAEAGVRDMAMVGAGKEVKEVKAVLRARGRVPGSAGI